MILKDNLIGTINNHNSVQQFSGQDSEKLFKENLKRQDRDWYYRKKPVNYKYNSNGHRCKEIVDVDFKNYILFLGCSITEGIGIDEKNTYSYLLSKQLNMDYYNLSVGSTGNDVIHHNLTVWLENYQRPKLIVVQLTDRTRFLLKDAKHLLPVNCWSTDESNLEFIVTGENIGYFESLQWMLSVYLNSINIPIITIVEKSSKPNVKFKNQLWYKQVDQARDINENNYAHPGIVTNKNIADDCFKLISDL